MQPFWKRMEEQQTEKTHSCESFAIVEPSTASLRGGTKRIETCSVISMQTLWKKLATYLTKHFKKTRVCDSGIHAITFIIACPALLWVYAWRPIGYKLSFAYP